MVINKTEEPSNLQGFAILPENCNNSENRLKNAERLPGFFLTTTFLARK
jgi:hypothetical protein